MALAIPTFPMSVFKLLITLCDELERFMPNIWWDQKKEERKIHWIVWDKIYRSKFKGGLGFKNLHTFNISFLAKQAWRVVQNEESLLHQVYKAKYFLHSHFFYAKLGHNPFYA